MAIRVWRPGPLGESWTDYNGATRLQIKKGDLWLYVADTLPLVPQAIYPRGQWLRIERIDEPESVPLYGEGAKTGAEYAIGNPITGAIFDANGIDSKTADDLAKLLAPGIEHRLQAKARVER